MAAPTPPPDTQAALLLYGHFAASPNLSPLSLLEYNAVARWLHERGRRPADLLRPDDLPAGDGLPDADRLRALLARGVQMALAVERWQRLGLWIVGRSEDAYPKRLKRNLHHAPPVLFGAGDVARLDASGLAVVGSRDVSDDGLAFTRRVAERCARDGVPVVSGGARGVDTVAMQSALAAGGRAVGVMADRLDRAATARDAKPHLRDGRLTLVSPYEPEVPFAVWRAMGRNKHIYALADHALVVQFTTGEGGTWAGAVERLRGDGALFVRVEGNPADGWNQLRELGARAFPAEAFDRDGAEALLPDAGRTGPGAESERIEVKVVQGTVAAEPGPGLPPLPAASCYEVCLPLILPHLRAEPGAKQLAAVAKQLVVTVKQLEEWLKLAVEDGRVVQKKKGRSKVYALPAATGGLFPGEDAA